MKLPPINDCKAKLSRRQKIYTRLYSNYIQMNAVQSVNIQALTLQV